MNILQIQESLAVRKQSSPSPNSGQYRAYISPDSGPPFIQYAEVPTPVTDIKRKSMIVSIHVFI